MKKDSALKVVLFVFFCISFFIWHVACNQAQKTNDPVNQLEDPYQNQTGFKSWTPESIKKTFPLVEKRGTFIVRSHSNHLPRNKFSCQDSGCHSNAQPGMEDKDIPQMPESCYECHDRESKMPIRIPE